MPGASNAAIIMATIVVVIVVIVAAYFTTVEVEKAIERSGNQGSMTSVYGKSFMNLPHGSLQSAALERADVGAGPGTQFHPQQVAGASFAYR